MVQWVGHLTLYLSIISLNAVTRYRCFLNQDVFLSLLEMVSARSEFDCNLVICCGIHLYPVYMALEN